MEYKQNKSCKQAKTVGEISYSDLHMHENNINKNNNNKNNNSEVLLCAIIHRPDAPLTSQGRKET